jgi:SAM-dependent methyltransferase
MTTLPFPDDTFDVVFCIAAMHHLPDEAGRAAALLEMKRVVKTGGAIIMLNWNVLGEWGREKIASGKWTSIGPGNDVLVPWKDDSGESLGERYYHGFSLSEIEHLAAATGLVIIENYYIKHAQPSTLTDGENIVTILKK